ncbi:cell surface protein [Mobiluncus mulieris]|uniref:Cell surface protein n=1 Tax=Mobiluncus mulieris TaxID=2052 RepID=A0A7Y0Y3R3_9ACTO|nr:cell surface protein [Mobiluncus mulieris]NMW64550.1 cell surface protein [Mobiluncus mulieris]
MKQWGRWLAVIAACALVTVANPFGAEASDTLPAIAPAGSTHGPITGDEDPEIILKKGAPTGLGTLTVQLYQGNPYDDIKAPNSVGVKIKVAKVKNVTLADSASWSDIGNLTIAQATQAPTTATTATTDNNGKAEFNNLTVGLYLVSPQETNTSFHPFLVTLPVADKARGEWNYHLVITPKPQAKPTTPPSSGGGTLDVDTGANSKDTSKQVTKSPTPTPSPSNSQTQKTSPGTDTTPTPKTGNTGEIPADALKMEKREKPPVGGVWMRAPNGDMILVAPNGEIIARLPATGVVATQIGGAALVLLALGMAILAWARRRAKRENDASHA